MKHISLLPVLCLLICCVACSAEETPPANNIAPSVSVSSNETTSTAVIENTTNIPATMTVPTTTYSTTVQTTATTIIIATTTKTTAPPLDGSQARGTTKDGFKWTRYQDIYFPLAGSSYEGRYEQLHKRLTGTFGFLNCVAITNYTKSHSERLAFPEIVEGYPVVTVSNFHNTVIKETVLPKYMTRIYLEECFPNVTDVYMPEAFVCGQLPYGMDEWPAEGITYHVPAASPLAAQLREKLTAAGVTHDLLTEDAVGVLNLSETDPIEADGKISFE